MLDASARLIEERLASDARVLDVGGAGRPFARADWVFDMIPYEARGELGWQGDPSAERFSAETWVQGDVCERTPWPFRDRQFDFAICSHTLEDVRDPVWVAAELSRVAAAGYVEVPAVLEELTYGVQGPWVGWGHHHWLTIVDGGRIEFVFKHHVINRRGFHLPKGSMETLSAEERVQTLWWEGTLEARERFLRSSEELDSFLRDAARQGPRVPFSYRARSALERVSPRLAAATRRDS